MKRAKEHASAAIIHFMVVGAIMALFMFGLSAGSFFDASESLLTGASVVGDKIGQLTVSSNNEWYQQLLSQYPVVTDTISNDKFTTCILHGDPEDVYTALVAVAAQAERQGDLVSYSLGLQ